jgi:hypothetical protein
MNRGSRHLGKIRLHFPAHKVPTSATRVRDALAGCGGMECGTRRQASKSGGTISQLGCSTSVACHGSPRKQQQQPIQEDTTSPHNVTLLVHLYTE